MNMLPDEAMNIAGETVGDIGVRQERYFPATLAGTLAHLSSRALLPCSVAGLTNWWSLHGLVSPDHKHRVEARDRRLSRRL